jgi:hypothetical protein
MTSGRAALILTAGIWIGLGAASQAPAATDTSTAPAAVKHHHLKKYAHHRPGKLADKSAARKTADATPDDSDSSATIPSSQIPASVANANAQLVPTANNAAQAAPVDAQATAAAPVVAADQLNDVDRALQAPAPAAAPVALASAEQPQAEAAPAPVPTVRASSESSTWDQTSLIGKVFIGFGALLTMASAARMFMA